MVYGVPVRMKIKLPILYRFVLFIASICVLMLFLYARQTGQQQGISIASVTMTSSINANREATNPRYTFSSDVDRIYCIIETRGIFGLPVEGIMWLRWYYENEQIAAHYVSIVPMWSVITSIEPPKDQKFRRGTYRVDIFLDLHSETTTVQFEIKE